MPNSEIAVAFLSLASSGRVREAYECFVHPSFRHHNPYFPGDAKSLADGMAQNARANPFRELRFEHVLDDGDFVATHARLRLRPDGPEMALVHIFRFEGDRIAELWDVGQRVPDSSPNKFGMF